MPDRIIRDELLTSDRWLGLKDNADRLAFVACLLRCDTLGNMEASPQQLSRLWRDFGIGTPAHVDQTLLNLSDAELVMSYHQGEKRYLHIPRFRQSRRYLGRVHPLPPWATPEEKQAVADYSHGARTVRSPRTPSAHAERTAGVGVGVGLEGGRKGVGVPEVIHSPSTTGPTSTPLEIPGQVKGNALAQAALVNKAVHMGLKTEGRTFGQIAADIAKIDAGAAGGTPQP